MNKLKTWPVLVLVASLVLAMCLVAGASASGVVHWVTVGGPDLCDALGAKPGCDANFSLVALQMADDSVEGQYHDQSSHGTGIHVAVNCLRVIGKQAWVSGVITQSRNQDYVGMDAVTTVVDNGSSANDPVDQISYAVIGSGIDCNDAPDNSFLFGLFSVPQGQVVVK